MPIANYGYKDGSGDFFISIDTDLCLGSECGMCVEACPTGVLELVEDELDPLAEELVVAVTEEHRKKIKYSCGPCKPVTGRTELPCMQVCKPGAIKHSW